MEKKRNFCDNFLFVGVGLSLISIVFIILAFSKYTFHSDCAAFLFLAKEQVVQGKLFPDRFHYTTTIFSIVATIFIVPFVNLISNDILLHEIGSIISIIVVVILLYILFKENKKVAFISAIVFLLPVGYTYMDMLFYQSAYIGSVIYNLAIIIAIKYLFSIEPITNKKMKIFIWSFYAIITLVINYTSIQSFLLMEIPILCAWGTMIVIREGGDVSRWVKRRKLLSFIIGTVIIILLCGIHYMLLCRRIGFDVNVNSGGWITPGAFFSSLNYTIPSIFDLYGFSGTDSVFSLVTIRHCIMFVYFVLSVFIIPVFLLMRTPKIKNPFYQFLVLYLNYTNFIIVFMMFFLGLKEGRYYIPACFNNILLYALCVVWLYENKKKDLGIWLLYSTICVAIFMHLGYYTSIRANGWYDNLTVESLYKPVLENAALHELKEEGYNYGFASFWIAYSNMYLSGEDIEIAAYDQGNPLMPYFFNNNNKNKIEYYGVSEDLYNPDMHQGKCFIIVYDGETIPDLYYYLADEVRRREPYTVLLFSKNIYLYDELITETDSRYVAVGDAYNFNFYQQQYDNNNFVQNGIACIMPRNCFALNPIDLQEGYYYLTVSSENRNQKMDVILQSGGEKIALDLVSEDENEKVYSFALQDVCEGSIITIYNHGEAIMKINKILISGG